MLVCHCLMDANNINQCKMSLQTQSVDGRMATKTFFIYPQSFSVGISAPFGVTPVGESDTGSGTCVCVDKGSECGAEWVER